MSLPRLWAFLAVALPTLAALVAALQSVDLAYHLRAGAQILDTGAIPATDTWTFTAAGLPWTDQQWGAQVVLEAVFRAGGWTGLVVLRAFLVAVTYGSMFVIGRRHGLGMRSAALLTLAAFAVSAAALALRPQLLGMALFALVLLLIDDRRAHPRRLWAIPILVLIWANLHGSFFLGPLVLGLAWMADVRDRVARPHRTLLVALVAAATACVTPFGPAVWTYAVGLSTNPQVTHRITEWQPSSLLEIPGALFYGSALAAAVLVARRRAVVPWPTLLWLAIFFAIGVYAARGVAWWSLAAVAPVASVLAAGAGGGQRRAEPAGTPSMRRINVVLAVVIVLAGVAVLPAWRSPDPALGAPDGVVASAPAGITAALRDLARPGDRVFNPQPWGSWFEFAVPGVPIAIDSRIELFPVGVWDAVDAVEAGRDGWARQLDDWGVTIAVVRAQEQGLSARLTAAGWTVVHSDADGLVLLVPGR